ncbi:uncharacterized protein [Antedon mediterranea]|uniref:uncharacterized protein n=1 Tax=Antedon mediterranea TaxID=105859 RepID=UPI003AF9000E
MECRSSRKILEKQLEEKNIAGGCPSYWTAYRGNCYKYFSIKVSWQTARSRCKSYGADLAVIKYSSENYFIGNLIQLNSWIGLTDVKTEGKFVWVHNGESSTYLNFNKGEPNDLGSEECVEVYNTSPYKWNDESCKSLRAYVCEKSESTVDVFVGTTYRISSLCAASSDKPFIGDFNGDGNTDVICHNILTGSKKIYYASCKGSFNSQQTWQSGMDWCHHSGEQLFIGDFNRDGRSDMMCHDRNTGYKRYTFAQPPGIFTGPTLHENINWCKTDQLIVTDFNGDGRDDMLCHSSNAYTQIRYAKTSGTFTTVGWQQKMNWCGSSNKLLTGDFNGDRRADLICHLANGHIEVILASASGKFTSSAKKHVHTDSWCKSTNNKLSIGYFNNDRRADLMCSDTSGPLWIAFSEANGLFTSIGWRRKTSWCTSSSNKLLIADVNGDGGDDLLCESSSYGVRYISLNKIL